MKIDNRQRLLAVLAIVIVALFVADRMILTPLTESWKSRSAAIGELRKSIEKGNGLIQREAQTRARWNEVRKSTLPVNAGDVSVFVVIVFGSGANALLGPEADEVVDVTHAVVVPVIAPSSTEK